MTSTEDSVDVLKETLCYLCKNDDKRETASVFCRECMVHMCSQCVQIKHDAFPLNKGHLLIDGTQYSTMGKIIPTLCLSRQCLKHRGEVLNIYCPEHDVMCCIVCKSLAHSNCTNCLHINDAAKKCNIGRKEYQNVIEATEASLSEVNREISEGKKKMTVMTEVIDRRRKCIGDFHTRLDNYFDVIETDSNEELQVIGNKNISELERDMKLLDACKSKTETLLRDLKSFDGDDESAIFVHVKEGKRILNDIKHCRQDMFKAAKHELVFNGDPRIEIFMKSIEKLGPFADKLMNEKNDIQQDTQNDPVSVDKINKPKTLQFDAGFAPLDLCVVNSNIIVAGYEKNIESGKVIRYDDSFEYIDCVKIPGRCYKICRSGDIQALVLYERTLDFLERIEKVDYNSRYEIKTYGSVIGKKLSDSLVSRMCFISVGKKMMLNKMVSIAGYPKTAVVNNGKTYVYEQFFSHNPYEDRLKKVPEAGPDYYTYDEKGEGFSIGRIYDMNMQRLRYIPDEPQLIAFCPEDIATTDGGLYITCLNKSNITKLDHMGNIVDTYNAKDSYLGICANIEECVFVFDSKSISRISVRQQNAHVLLQKQVKDDSIQALTYDRNHSRIVFLSFDRQYNYTLQSIEV